jgi:hypothetical protein
MIGSVQIRSDLARSGAQTTRSDGVGGTTSQLRPDEQRKVAELKQRDAEVRRHEQAHAAAGGAHTGAPHYHFEQGPDGQLYAVAGEVAVDASPVRDDPSATILKMQQVMRAALAPADPSGQDQRVAAAAAAALARARLELALEGSGQAKAADRAEPASGVSRERASSDPSASAEPALRSQALSAYRDALNAPESSSLNLVACANCGQGHSR